jgi:hypothetical protein
LPQAARNRDGRAATPDLHSRGAAQRHLLVLGLETIAELKRQSSEAKDRLMLPVLEETLKRRR